MDRKSPSIGVQLVEIKDLDHKDVKVPDHKIYLVHCLADPKPGNEFGWVDPIPVYAIVSLSLEKFQEIQECLKNGWRFNLNSVEQLMVNPRRPFSDENIIQVLNAREVLKFNPRWMEDGN